MEFKDHSGKLQARQNGHWSCDGKDIKGGANGKSVFDQLKTNYRNLRDSMRSGKLLEERQYINMHALVVLTKLDEFDYGDLDDKNRKWISATDVDHIGAIMPQIKMKSYYDKNTGRYYPSNLTNQNIWGFIRKCKIDERSLLIEYSATHVMPPDLFHKDYPHNGKRISTEDKLHETEEKIKELEDKIKELKDKIRKILEEHDRDKLTLIQDNNKLQNSLIASKDELIRSLAAMEQLEQENKKLKEEKEKLSSAASRPAENSPIVQPSPEVAPSAAGSSIMQPEPAPGSSIMQPAPTPGEAAPAVTPAPVTEPQTTTRKPGKTKFGQMAKKVLKTFNVSSDKLDVEQLEIIERTMDHPLIIGGTAGSGKSIIAVYKTEQILAAGYSAILISFTKSLRTYMSHEMRNAAAVYHYHGWVKDGRPRADYIIVDEIQDFAWARITEFVSAAGRAFFFFGDTAQSIYREGMKLSDIAARLNLSITRLHNNYRLPKAVACIAQQYIADRSYDWDEYNDSGYRSTEKGLPYFLHYADDNELLLGMIRIITAKKLKETGILLPNNETLAVVRDFCQSHGLECDFKYNKKDDEESRGGISSQTADSEMILDFSNHKPKLMTYHSAKGLQFETVIMPFVGYNKPFSDFMRRAAYVAMTRTYRYLYLLYSSAQPPAPFDQVPSQLYQKQPPV